MKMVYMLIIQSEHVCYQDSKILQRNEFNCITMFNIKSMFQFPDFAWIQPQYCLCNKQLLFQAAVVSILLYGCTTWTLTKRLEKKLDGNYTRMLRAILNKSWRQHPKRHRLYGHLPPITKTIQGRRSRPAGHCWRSRDELISDVLRWTPAYGRAKAGRPARTYIQQLCEDTGCSPEDLPEATSDREKWRERVRDINASGTTWWWWWWKSKHSCFHQISHDHRCT